jgi:ATP-binding cassette subfamily B multidrug efflux pump
LISFARALAFDPKILILDEATSSIDTETEQLIQQAVDRVMQARTSLVVAHRLSTIQKCDRIFVFHHGELREAGTHHELLGVARALLALYQLQYVEEKIHNSLPPQQNLGFESGRRRRVKNLFE